MENVVAYSMINKGENNMNELNCKKCDKVTIACDEGVVSVTCSKCVMLDSLNFIDGLMSDDGTIIKLDSNLVGEA